MKKVIKGIGLLDLTTATKESLKGLNEIKGVGCVLIGENNQKILEGVEQKGVGTCITVPDFDKDSVVVKTGIGRFDAAFFEGVEKQVVLVVVGIAVFESDVTKEMAQKKIMSISGSGVIACPKNIAGIVNTKQSGFTGVTAAYENDAVTSIGDLKITNEYLEGLKDGSSLLSVGDVALMADIDEDLFKKKITNVHYVGDIIAYERYQSMLSMATGEGDMTYIPDGYQYFGKAELSASQAEMMEGERWYVGKTLFIKGDVTEAMLKSSLEAVYCTRVVCPRHLVEALKPMLQNQPKFLPYSHKVRVYESHTLTATHLKYEKNPVCIMVTGKLIMDEDITEELLEEKVEFIDNYGSVTCQPEIFPAVMDKVREDKGRVAPKEKEKQSDEIVIAKGMGFLKL